MNEIAVKNATLINSLPPKLSGDASKLVKQLRQSTEEILRLEKELAIEFERATHYRDLWQDQSQMLRAIQKILGK